MKIKPAFEWIDPEAASRVFIVWYKHGQEPIRLHELSQVFKNVVQICTWVNSLLSEQVLHIGLIVLDGHRLTQVHFMYGRLMYKALIDWCGILTLAVQKSIWICQNSHILKSIFYKLQNQNLSFL